MTDVLRSNFEKLLPQMIEQIEKCTFVAIDAEYTGLYPSDSKDKHTMFDLPSDRYGKLRTTLSKFLISQFGVSIFEKDWEGNLYRVDTYNVYLFPVSFDQFGHRATIQCQVSCLNFLASNNFDYNKFIREGVPYMREEDVILLRNYLKASPSFMSYMENRDKFYFPSYSSPLNEEEIEEIVDRLTGFTKIIRAIRESRKPVVGHNMLMDLMLLYNQFCEDLPESYEIFKSKMHSVLPVVFDTKHLAASIKRTIAAENPENTKVIESLYDSNLFALYHKTHAVRGFHMPIITPVNGSLNYKEDLAAGVERNLEPEGQTSTSKSHEAGFDACLTGILFIRLVHLYNRHVNRTVNRFDPLTATETISSVNKWKNQVNLSRAVVTHIDISEPGDIPPSKPNWILAKKKVLPNALTLRSQLIKYGDVEIKIIDSNSALIACGNWHCARDVWSHLEGCGFSLSAQNFPKSSTSESNFARVAAIWAVSTTIVGVVWWCLKR